MTMQFGTDAVRHLTRSQLAAKYAQVRTAVLATEYGKSFAKLAGERGTLIEDAFDYHVSFSVDEIGIRGARQHVMAAFGQLHVALTKTSHQISPETLQWGGFLSGHIVHDFRDADAACLALLSEPV